MRQVFFDTETTGLSPETGDRVVEIGCVEMIDRRLTGNNKHFHLNPERKNSEEAQRIHGLTDEFLATQPVFAAIADELMDYLAGAEVVIHNAAFDVGFMNEELRRIGRAKFPTWVGKVSDSLLLAREMFPGKANSLDALCKRLEVDNSNRTLHGALLDAGLLAEVYVNMTRGQKSLVMEAGSDNAGPGATLALQDIDLSSFELPTLAAEEAELLAHEAVLKELDKASSGKTIWRNLLA
jgi:DNA polymerase III subunit epsilon